VNFYGELRVLTTFAPLLRQADQIGQSPRALWLGSIFGASRCNASSPHTFLAAGSMELPGMGPYLISKHALEAAAHTFAYERHIFFTYDLPQARDLHQHEYSVHHHCARPRQDASLVRLFPDAVQVSKLSQGQD
jgi:hypothetical protein